MSYRWIGIIGIIIFIYLLFNINLTLLINQFKNINLLLFSISLLVIIPCIFLKALKWLLLVNKEDRISLVRAMIAWVAGFGVGIITPARVGDFLRAKFLKVRLSEGLPTVLIDRLNDVLTLFIFGILCIFVILSKAIYFSYLAYLFVLFFVLFLFGVFILTNRNLILKIGNPFYKFFVPKKFKRFIGNNFNDFYGTLNKLKKKEIILNFILTIFTWAIGFVQYWFLALALGLNLSYFIVFLVSPILLLVQLIPISISGIGTREAAAVLLLSVFGVSPELAIAFSLGILLEDYILGGIGLLIWTKIKNLTS